MLGLTPSFFRNCSIRSPRKILFVSIITYYFKSTNRISSFAVCFCGEDASRLLIQKSYLTDSQSDSSLRLGQYGKCCEKGCQMQKKQFFRYSFMKNMPGMDPAAGFQIFFSSVFLRFTGFIIFRQNCRRDCRAGHTAPGVCPGSAGSLRLPEQTEFAHRQ